MSQTQELQPLTEEELTALELKFKNGFLVSEEIAYELLENIAPLILNVRQLQAQLKKKNEELDICSNELEDANMKLERYSHAIK